MVLVTYMSMFCLKVLELHYILAWVCSVWRYLSYITYLHEYVLSDGTWATLHTYMSMFCLKVLELYHISFCLLNHGHWSTLNNHNDILQNHCIGNCLCQILKICNKNEVITQPFYYWDKDFMLGHILFRFEVDWLLIYKDNIGKGDVFICLIPI